MTRPELQSSNAVPLLGYLVEYSQAFGEQRYNHVFCGSHSTPGAFCPNCSKRLLRLLSVDLTDRRIQTPITVFSQLSLYYCWTCALSQGEFSYMLIEGGSVEIVQITSGNSVPGFPYPNYPEAFPVANATLRRLTIHERRAIAEMNSGTFDEGLTAGKQFPHLVRPRHQVGGEPLLMQGWFDVVCPLCSNRIPLVASIGNDCLDPRGIIGYDYAQILYHFCRSCSVVVANNVCD